MQGLKIGIESLKKELKKTFEINLIKIKVIPVDKALMKLWIEQLYQGIC